MRANLVKFRFQAKSPLGPVFHLALQLFNLVCEYYSIMQSIVLLVWSTAKIVSPLHFTEYLYLYDKLLCLTDQTCFTLHAIQIALSFEPS